MKTKSARIFQTIMLMLCSFCMILGISVLSLSRAGDTRARAAVNQNYAQAYIFVHTAEYDSTNLTFGEVTSKQKENNSVITDGKYVLLNTPVLEGDVLTWYSVRFILGGQENYRINALSTGSISLNGDNLVATAKTHISPINQTDYEVWTQDIYAVIPKALADYDSSGEPVDATSKEYKADQLLAAYAMKYTSETPTAELRNTTISQYDGLEGQYALFYTYAQNTGTQAITETFNFYLLTSSSYDIEKNVVFDNVDSNAVTADASYRTQNYYQFTNTTTDMSNLISTDSLPIASADTMDNIYCYTGPTTASYVNGAYYKTIDTNGTYDWVRAESVYPTLSYNPEKYKISYNFTQYIGEQTTTLDWAKTFTTTNDAAGNTLQTISLTLTQNTTYQNGNPNSQIVYALQYTKTTALNGTVTYGTDSYSENGQPVVTSPVICRLENSEDYVVTLVFRTPGAYKFNKQLLLNSGTTTTNGTSTVIYNIIEKNDENDDITLSDENIFKPEMLRIYGYTATYAHEGTTQKHLYAENYVDLQYISDFSFLLDETMGDSLTSSVTLTTYASKIETYLTQNTTLVRASTNQGPVIVSSSFYMPDRQSTIAGYYYNAKVGTDLIAVTKNTRFVDAGVYYVILQTSTTSVLVSNDDKKFVYQLLSFEITNSPVTPKICKTTEATIDDAYANISSAKVMQDKEYTNQNVFLTWTTPSPFDRAVTVQYYYSTAYNTSNITYTDLGTSNLYHDGDTTYTKLFTENAYYRFKITSNKNTTAYYNFYIDKTPISNIVAYNTKMEDGKTYLNLTSGIIDYFDANKTTSITNSQFGWNWSQKVSGAPISATRYFASIGANTSYTASMLQSINAITTNGALGEFGDPLTYRDTTTISIVDGQKVVSANALSPSQILKNAGIYVLYLSDSAGNTASFVTILDNTSPTLYITDTSNAVLTETYLSDSAKVFWEENKAIKINKDGTNYLSPVITTTQGVSTASFALDGKQIAISADLFGTIDDGVNTTNYLLIKNNQVNIFSGTTNNTLTINQNTKYVQLLVDKDDDNPSVCVVVSNQATPIMVFSLKTVNSISYTFTLYDALENDNQTTLTFSLDQSGIQMFSFSDNAAAIFNLNANNTNKQQVLDTYGTNRNIVAVKWQNPSNPGVVIDSIVLEYYPLLDDTDIQSISTNYPYASTPYTTYTIYSKDETTSYTTYPGDITKYLSPALITINTPTLLSQAGKYVVSRTYTDTFSTSGHTEGDQAERTFVFYVDRGDIINKNYAQYTISYGYPTEYYPAAYEGYGQETSTTEMLSGNNNNFSLMDIDLNWSNITYVIQGTKVSVSINSPIYEFDDGENSLDIKGYKYIPSGNAGMSYANQQDVLELMSSYINSLKTVVCVQHNNNNRFTRYYTYKTDPNSKYLDISQLKYAFTTPGNYRVLIFDRMNAQGPITNDPVADMSSLLKLSSAPNHIELFFEISNTSPSGQFMSKNNIESNYNILNTSSVSQYNTNHDYVIFTFSEPSNKYDATIAYKDVQISAEYKKFGNTVSTDTIATIAFDASKRLDSVAEIENISVSSPTLYYYGTGDELKTYYIVLPTSVTSATYNNTQLDRKYEITLRYIKTTSENEFSPDVYSSTSSIYIDHTAPYTNLYKLIDNDKYLTDLEALYPGTKAYIKQHLDDSEFDFLKHYVFTVTEDFYLTYSEPNDTNAAKYRTYGQNGIRNYDGTTYTEITKGFYPTNSTEFYHYNVYHEDGTGGVSLDRQSGSTSLYRPFKAGNYYDIIESDRSDNYRAYTIYVTGKQTTTPGSDATSNLITSAQSSSTLYTTLSLANLSNLLYLGLNASDNSNIVGSSTYSNLTYDTETFRNITTNTSSELYSQIIRYTLYTQAGSTTYTIVYYHSDDSSNTIQQLLNLSDKTNVTFVSSKQDLLDTLNSIITEAANTYQYSTGSKIKFEFLNKLSGNPYYAVSTRISKGSVVIINKYVQLDSMGLDIIDSYDLTINTRGVDIVNSEADFVESTANNRFNVKIPASNISTRITSIVINNLTEILDYDATTDTYSLNTTSFSLSQSYSFRFVDNFGVSKTFTYPIDSQYAQELVFKDGSAYNTYNLLTYNITVGDTQFVYDSNHLRYINIFIDDLNTSSRLLYYSNYNLPDEAYLSQPGEEGEGTESTISTTLYASDLSNCADFLTTSRGTDGSTTISFTTFPNVCYKYTIEVGSDINNMDNPTRHVYLLYTIFPTVTITDTNGANMLSDTQDLITSKDLLVGLVPNSRALYNPVAYLVRGTNQTEISSETDILINENATYQVILKNDIGTYSNGIITFTRKSYDISIYGVYYKNGNDLNALVKKNQGYRYSYQLPLDPDAEEGTEPATVSKVIDRYMFASSNANDWNNITILLNENKQLKWEKIADDTANNTRIYRVYSLEGSAYNIQTYFAITRIPAATGGIVDDFRINDLKPQSSNLTQLYPTITDTTPKEAILTWTSTFTFNEESEDVNNTIQDFYVVDLWLNGTYVGAYSSGYLRLYQSGTYTIKIHDLLGQYKTFSNTSTSYNISIYRDVVYSVNDNNPIQNATFNDSVTITISNISQYRDDFDFSVMRNSNVYDAALTNGSFTFTEAGVYIVTMTGTLNGMGNNVNPLTSEYRFSIISSNEARLTYEFSKKSGYTITSIYKNGELMVDENGKTIAPLYSLSLNAENEDMFGKGKYEITVSVKGEGLVPTMTYTYTIWINNETAILNSTRDWGTDSIQPFTIKLNPSVVYSRIGNCYITINGQVVLTIDETNSETNEELSYTCRDPGVYIIQMYSQSGNLISSQRITINEPLNTIAIVLIALAAVVVVGLVLMFVIIRKRQKVK